MSRWAALVCIALALTGSAARGQTTQDDVATLNDRHASSALKLSACRRLRNSGPGGEAVCAALARQALYDMAEVRDAAREALERVAGRQRAERLIAAARAAADAAGARGPWPDLRAARRAAAINAGQSIDKILDPRAPYAEAYAQLRALERSGLDSPGMRLIFEEAAYGEPHERAQWALWCLLGPEVSRWAIRLVPGRDDEPLARWGYRKWVMDLADYEDLRLAAAMIRSPWPELRSLGESAVRRMQEVTAGARGAASGRAAADALLRELAKSRERTDRIELDDGTARHAYPDTTLRTALRRYDDPDPALRRAARAYWESMLHPKTGELAIDAAAALARLVANADEPPAGSEARLWAQLDRAGAGGRRAAEAVWVEATSFGNGRADAALSRWRVGDSTEARVARALWGAAREVGRVPREGELVFGEGSVDALRRWAVGSLGSHDGRPTDLAVLLSSDSAPLARHAAAIAAIDPERFAAARAVAVIIEDGTGPKTPGVLAALRPIAAAIGPVATKALANPPTQRAALAVLADVGAADDATRAALTPLLRGGAQSIRRLAAAALGTEEAWRVVRVPELWAELRSPNSQVRSRAAHEAMRLAIDAPAVTGALVRAVDSGDLAAREGLVLALERAWAAQAPAAAVLAAADAERDPTARAYLRAARRAAELR